MIDNINDLLKAEPDVLDEMLLDEKYNKPNLRELIRRLIKDSQERIKYMEYLKEEISEQETTIRQVRRLAGRTAD